MRAAFVVLTGLALSAYVHAESSPLRSISDLRWLNRIILVDGATRQTVKDLEARASEIDERQLVWFCVDSAGIQTNYRGTLDAGLLEHLREAYFDKSGFPVLLIGKDGGLKSRDRKLDIGDYLDKIDGMPMRRAEMESSSPD